MSTLKKARLYPLERPDDVFYVQFNPNTLSYAVEKKSKKKKENSKSISEQNDITGQTGHSELSMTLFFYTYRTETDYDDVRKSVNRLRPFMDRKGDKDNISGQRIGFAWGTLTVVGYLEDMRVSYQMFAEDGTPVQAEVEITIVGEDIDVKADGVNYAKSVEIKERESSSWLKNRDKAKQSPEEEPEIAWLFT